MPSLILGNQSGGQLIVSGGYYSGRQIPVGGIQLALDRNALGAAYIALSGNMTTTSGAVAGSGGASSGLLDGLPVIPGGSYFVPKLGCGLSGLPSIYASVDAAGSGQARLYYEIF